MYNDDMNTLREGALNDCWSNDIVRAARNKIGWKGDSVTGQCKAWAQKLILDTTGVMVPRNDFTQDNPRDCSNKYRWHEADDRKKHPHIVATSLAQLTVVSPGQIWQVLWHKKAVKNPWHIHTLIYLGKDDAGNIQCIDCNWKGDLTVREHDIPKHWWDKSFDKGTVYTIIK